MHAHVSRNHHVTIPSAYNIARAFLDSATVLGFQSAFIEPRKTPDSLIISGQQAYLSVTGTTGPWPRDSTDRRLIREVLTGAGKWQDSCDPVPDPYQPGTGRAPTDTDRDGMPDTWESGHGLNPSNAADRTTSMNGGYNAVEVYLNELADQLVPPDLAVETQPMTLANRAAWGFAHPNPFRSAIEFHFSHTIAPGTPVTLLSPDGRVAASFRSTAAPLRWNAGQLPNGLYLIKIKTGTRVFTDRILLQR